jgi:stalled ribosome rescue protein Dom34
LWIDHRKAVIVVVSERGEETTQIESHVERQPGRVAGVRSTTPYESQHVPADDSHQRKFTGQLNDYYDEVVALIRGAESILIFGPGEAKDELNKRLERDNLGGRVVAVQTSDRMTDREIAAKIREYFQE